MLLLTCSRLGCGRFSGGRVSLLRLSLLLFSRLRRRLCLGSRRARRRWLRGRLFRVGRGGWLGCLLRLLGCRSRLLRWLRSAFLRRLFARLARRLRRGIAGRIGLRGARRGRGAKADTAARSLNRFVRLASRLLFLRVRLRLFLYSCWFRGGFWWLALLSGCRFRCGLLGRWLVCRCLVCGRL